MAPVLAAPEPVRTRSASLPPVVVASARLELVRRVPVERSIAEARLIAAWVAATVEPVATDPAAADAPTAAPDPTPASAPAPTEAATAPSDATPADSATPVPDAPAPVELLMPPAPTEPSAAQHDRIASVVSGGRRAGTAVRDIPDAQQSTDAARASVDEPAAQTKAKAEQRLVAALGSRPEPSPAILKLCDDIRTAIRERRPVDEDDLLTAKPQEAAREAGGTLSGSIEVDSARVEAGYDQLRESPSGTPPPAAPDLVPPARSVALGDPAATTATPDPIPSEHLSLDADQAAIGARVDESRILRPSTEPIRTPPFSEVREGQAELAELAADGPAQIATEQQAAIDGAGADMADLQLRALDALAMSRASGAQKIGTRQRDMVGRETDRRTIISGQAQTIFTDTQTAVRAQLEDLTSKAMAQWDAGLARLSTRFDQDLAEVQAKVDDRHSGVGGKFLSAWDWATGLPGWVTRAYDRAEKAFGDGVCTLLVDISRDVNAVIAVAQALVEDGRRRIDDLFVGLDGELTGWAVAERAKFAGQLDSLAGEVRSAQQDFERGVTERAVTAVNDVHAKVEALREKAKGVIGRIADAIAAFIDDPIRAIINGLLSIVGIAPEAFWALVDKIGQAIEQIADDPIGFVNNLVAALGQGFSQFFDHFPTHLLAGFWTWLFSAPGPAGVQVPTDASASSILTFILQVLGVSWAKIRTLIEKRLGPKALDVAEQVWEVASTFVTKGWAGLQELLAPMLDPSTLIRTVVDTAIDYVVETLIKQVAVRVLGMLNPAGAVVQAIELIYKVLKWVFQNAARIFSLVETVVNGITDILAGNFTGMAKAIETALAGLVPIVIAFLADLLGLGDLPQRVLDAVKQLQSWVERMLDRVIGWLIDRGKALLAKLGVAGTKPGDDPTPAPVDTELGEHVRFAADGEPHTIWFDANGPVPVLMMASSPTPMKDKLDKLEREGQQRWKRHPTTHLSVFNALMTQARGLYLTADADGRAAKKAFDATRQKGAQPTAYPDAKAEQAEKDLAVVLKKILGMLGHQDADKEILDVEIARALVGHARRFFHDARDYWYNAGLAGFEIALAPGTKTHLWANRAKLDPAGDEAERSAALTTNIGRVRPWFRSMASGQRSAATGQFYDFAFSTRATNLSPKGGVVRSAVLQATGLTAAETLRLDALAQINAAAQLAPADRQVLQAEFANRPVFTPGPVFGSLTMPKPGSLHRDFAIDPKFKREQTAADGTLTLWYKTISGEEFDVTVSVDSGYQHVVKGTGLKYHRSGRGVVQDTVGVGTGLGRDRAHLVADEFRGSGFAEALNTLTTSSHYNQKVMRAQERAIVSDIDTRAKKANVDPYTVTINLEVMVEFEQYHPGNKTVLVDKAFVAGLAKSTAGKSTAVIMNKVRESLMQQLHRVHDVSYTWTVFHPNGTSLGGKKNVTIGRDKWM